LIKDLRLKEGMTQQELAKKFHIKKSVISQMENHIKIAVQRYAALSVIVKVDVLFNSTI